VISNAHAAVCGVLGESATRREAIAPLAATATKSVQTRNVSSIIPNRYRGASGRARLALERHCVTEEAVSGSLLKYWQVFHASFSFFFLAIFIYKHTLFFFFFYLSP
jgi:hypothetical protein